MNLQHGEQVHNAGHDEPLPLLSSFRLVIEILCKVYEITVGFRGFLYVTVVIVEDPHRYYIGDED